MNLFFGKIYLFIITEENLIWGKLLFFFIRMLSHTLFLEKMEFAAAFSESPEINNINIINLESSFGI